MDFDNPVVLDRDKRLTLVRVPDPKRGLEMKFRSESTATFVCFFFALMGRKHDAEVEFTCCHSQKVRKLAFRRVFCPT